jgi:hypothetical protein
MLYRHLSRRPLERFGETLVLAGQILEIPPNHGQFVVREFGGGKRQCLGSRQLAAIEKLADLLGRVGAIPAKFGAVPAWFTHPWEVHRRPPLNKLVESL